MYLADIFTIAANLAGICGISIPCGFAEVEGKSLPIGLQLLGKTLRRAASCRSPTPTSKARHGTASAQSFEISAVFHPRWAHSGR